MIVLCVICEKNIEENAYAAHMQAEHPEGQLASLQKKRLIKQNISPAAGLPPGISEADLPDQEFLKTVAEIENSQTPAPPTLKPQEEKPPISPTTPPPAVSRKPVKLTYKYEGECEKGHPVSTLEIDISGSHHVIAYCTVCKIQCLEREVADLREKLAKEAANGVKKGKKNASTNI